MISTKGKHLGKKAIIMTRTMMNMTFIKALQIFLLIITSPVSVPFLLVAKGHRAAAYTLFAVEALLVILFTTYGNQDHLFG